MTYVINKITECDDGKPRMREISKIEKVVVHKVGDSLGETGPEIARSFKDTSKYAAGSYTGGEMPYTFIIRKDGTIDQCLPMTDTGPHARKWNSSSVSVACIGDFTKHAPTNEQECALIDLLTALAGYGLTIHGHTELPGSSSDPKKQCPGPHLDLNAMRNEVKYKLETKRLEALLDVGIKI
jgi:hypothetical protein